MSEPDVEAVIEAAQKRSRARVKPASDPLPASTPVEAPVSGQPPVPVQPVTLQAKPEPDVADDDPQLANLLRIGMTVEQARELVKAQRRMW